MKFHFLNTTLALAVTSILLTSCSENTPFNEPPKHEKADLVVYGRIFTSKNEMDMANAFAVKDGKYIYIGDSLTASEYVGDATDVVEHRHGLIIAGCTDAHAHYVKSLEQEKMMNLSSVKSYTSVLQKLRLWIKENPDAKTYYGYGFDAESEKSELKGDSAFDYTASLDLVCPDIPVYISDASGYYAIANTCLMNRAGIRIMPDSIEGTEDIPGGEICRMADGKANGFFKGDAASYLLKFTDELLTKEQIEYYLLEANETVNSQGYTYVYDAETNAFPGNHGMEFETLNKLDESLTFLARPSYALTNLQWNHLEAELEEAKAWHESSKSLRHILPMGIIVKVDSEWGHTMNPNDGGCELMTQGQLSGITSYANNEGIPVQAQVNCETAVHNALMAFTETASATAFDGKNSLSHLKIINTEDANICARSNISIAGNPCWHIGTAIEETAQIEDWFGYERWQRTYPIKSLLNRGVNLAHSTNTPYTKDMPKDIFSAIEIMCSVVYNRWWDNDKAIDPYATQELITVPQAIMLLTKNGAKAMDIEQERGSIELGKYADFLLMDKNILLCNKQEIHNTRLEKVFFEGREVWSK